MENYENYVYISISKHDLSLKKKIQTPEIKFNNFQAVSEPAYMVNLLI